MTCSLHPNPPAAPIAPRPALADAAGGVPARNPTVIASDGRWEAVRAECQLFHDLVEAVATGIRPCLPETARNQLIQAVIRERIADSLRQTLGKLRSLIATRFAERRVLDNECYYMEVTDILTGEREEFGWTYGGGLAASQWKVERLLALAGKGVAA